MWLSATRRSGRWAKALLKRAHHNVAVVAFANKLARIAWAVLRHGERFAARDARGGVEDRPMRTQSVDRPTGVCERVTTRWPDSRTALRKPGLKNGARRREFYEDRSARISIMAGGNSSRPDTLMQTDQQPISKKPLADGAGHTFLKASTAPAAWA